MCVSGMEDLELKRKLLHGGLLFALWSHIHVVLYHPNVNYIPNLA